MFPNKIRSVLLGVALIGLLTMASCADVQSADSAKMKALPPGESVLSPSGLGAFSLFGLQKDLGTFSIVNVDHDDFHQAMQVQTEPGAKAEWFVQIIAPVTKGVKKGDVLLGHFWMRCVTSMTGEGYTGFVFEIGSPPYDKATELAISSGPKWREVFVPFVAPRDFPQGKARIDFRAGYDRQTIQIADVQVIDYGSQVKIDDLPETKITYAGRAADAQWRKDALARIEKIRKGDLDIYVTDANGAPMSGARVHAVLRRNAFGFGTCVDADLILGTSPDAQRYRQAILKLFNRAVFENEMKWQATWNGVPPDVDRALNWLLKNHILVRGHNLVWPSWQWLPRQLKAYEHDPAKLREITDKHITYMVSHFRGKLVDWDVVNEPYSNHDLIDLLGGRQIMVHWFDARAPGRSQLPAVHQRFRNSRRRDAQRAPG